MEINLSAKLLKRAHLLADVTEFTFFNIINIFGSISSRIHFHKILF